MPLLSLTEERCRYYKQIKTYEARREGYRKKFGIANTFPFKGTPEYKKAVENINLKIKLWGRRIAFIDKRVNQIIALNNAIAIFTGVNLKNIGNSTLEGVKLAKYLFYKYGLENKIQAKQLREWVGAKRTHQPSEYRTEFTKSFTTNPENKQKWLTFKAHMAEQMELMSKSVMKDERRTPGA